MKGERRSGRRTRNGLGDLLDEDRLSEDGSTENVSDGSVRGLKEEVK